MTIRPVLSLLIVVCLGAAAADARAAPADSIARRELIRQAEAAHAAGKHADALGFGVRAGALEMTTSLRYFIAREQEETSALMEGYATAEQCLIEAERDPKLRNRDAILAECRDIKLRLSGLLARVVVHVAERVPGLKVRVAGHDLNDALIDVPYVVLPGKIDVEVTAPDWSPFRTSVEVSAGIVTTVVADLHRQEPESCPQGTIWDGWGCVKWAPPAVSQATATSPVADRAASSAMTSSPGTRQTSPSVRRRAPQLADAPDRGREFPAAILGIKLGMNILSFPVRGDGVSKVFGSRLTCSALTGSLHVGGDGYFFGVDLFYSRGTPPGGPLPIHYLGLRIHPINFGYFFSDPRIFVSISAGGVLGALIWDATDNYDGGHLTFFSPRVASGVKWLGTRLGLALDAGLSIQGRDGGTTANVFDIAIGLQIF